MSMKDLFEQKRADQEGERQDSGLSVEESDASLADSTARIEGESEAQYRARLLTMLREGKADSFRNLDKDTEKGRNIYGVVQTHRDNND